MTKDNQPTAAATSNIMHPPIGIALGSGMARGFAHIGVMKALMRHNIEPTVVAGTSIGAVVGGCYLAGKIPELEEWALGLNRSKIFKYLDFRVRAAGLIGGKRLEKLMKDNLRIGQIDLLK